MSRDLENRMVIAVRLAVVALLVLSTSTIAQTNPRQAPGFEPGEV